MQPAHAVTRLLDDIRAGNDDAWSRLLPLVYEELRSIARHRLAQLRPGQTLASTDLVHEAYLKLFQATGGGWNSFR